MFFLCPISITIIINSLSIHKAVILNWFDNEFVSRLLFSIEKDMIVSRDLFSLSYAVEFLGKYKYYDLQGKSVRKCWPARKLILTLSACFSNTGPGNKGKKTSRNENENRLVYVRQAYGNI